MTLRKSSAGRDETGLTSGYLWSKEDVLLRTLVQRKASSSLYTPLPLITLKLAQDTPLHNTLHCTPGDPCEKGCAVTRWTGRLA